MRPGPRTVHRPPLRERGDAGRALADDFVRTIPCDVYESASETTDEVRKTFGHRR